MPPRSLWPGISIAVASVSLTLLQPHQLVASALDGFQAELHVTDDGEVALAGILRSNR